MPSSTKNIFKLKPSSLEFTTVTRNRALEGDRDTPKLYILKDDYYEPPSHQLVGIIDHGTYILFGPVSHHHDSTVLFTKEYKYDEGDDFKDGFVVQLIPQSSLKYLPFLPCEQEFHEKSKKIRVFSCVETTNATLLVDTVARKDDVFYIHKEHKLKHQSMSSRALFHNQGKRQVFEHGTVFTGKGSVVVITDTFLDESHGAFFDPNEPLIDQYNVLTSHSKIVAILNGKTGPSKRTNRFDVSHGTKVASETVGNKWLTESGVAPDSKLVFIETEITEGSVVPYNYMHTLKEAYLLGARSAGISWVVTEGNGEFTYLCYEFDTLVHKLIDLAVAVSAGNDNTKLTSPVPAKLIASTGASYGNEMSEYHSDGTIVFSYRDAAEFTAHGPTQTGRRVPLFLAQGVNTRGARSKKVPYPSHETLETQSGTSFAPCTIVGAYALIEEKYRQSLGVPTWMFKNSFLIAFARSPDRVINTETGKVSQNKNSHVLLGQTYGTPVVPNFDTVQPFVRDRIPYSGKGPFVHQFCLRLETRQTARVVVGWNDLNTVSGKLAYRLDLTVFSESEVRSSSDSTSVYQVVDITGQTLRVRVTSPNLVRFALNDAELVYALTTNVTATQVSCAGSCSPETKPATNCSDTSVRYCLHTGEESPCVLSRCSSGFAGWNCTKQTTKKSTECAIGNGYGVLVEQECLAYECRDGYFISSQSSCSCLDGSTHFDETNKKLGICTDFSLYRYEEKSVFSDQLEMVSLQSAATQLTISPTFFFFFFLIINFFV